MAKGFPFNVRARAENESRVYQDAYQTALVKLLGSIDADGTGMTVVTAGKRADFIARAAVDNYRAWLVEEGYTDLAEECDE